MIDITLHLDDNLAFKALQQARESGADLHDFLITTLSQSLGATADSPVAASPAQAGFEPWLEDAVSCVTRLSSGHRFKLQDLFSKEDWKKIPSPTVFGRNFRKRMEESGLAQHVDKTAMNQAIYARI